MFVSNDNVGLQNRWRFTDLAKDSGRLLRHSKVCDREPGRVCSEVISCIFYASTTT